MKKLFYLFILCGLIWLTSCNFSINISIKEESSIEPSIEESIDDLTIQQTAIYNLAVKSGYTGTYEEWLASISGDEIELAVQQSAIVWKYKSDTNWIVLISLDELKGETGKDGVDGQPGKDGITPKFKVEAGNMYVSYDEGKTWEDIGTICCEHCNDNTIYVIPKLQINQNTNEWEVSYDEGQTWESLGINATGENGLSIISVELNEFYQLIITLSDNSKLPPVSLPNLDEKILKLITINNAKIIFDDYIKQYVNNIDEYLVYNENDYYVVFKNDEVVDVFNTKEEVLINIFGKTEGIIENKIDKYKLSIYKEFTPEEITWEIGSIAASNGLNISYETRLRTIDYLQLSNFNGVTIDKGYELTYLAYDENYKYLGNGSGTTSGYWLGSGIGVLTSDIKSIYPNAIYFRLALKNSSNTKMSLNDVANSNINFYLYNEQIPESKVDLEYSDVFSIGSWQDGAIYNGKLFTLGSNGNGSIFDLNEKKNIGSFVLDKKEIITPHANSVFFGNLKYDNDDIYPLLYANVYNNYASSTNRMEGTCCVYRLREENGTFITNLVQIIRIGFIEDIDLWKSKPNNEDVRPYGNFIVDVDNNKLYTFVMRDKEKITRFFQFDVPNIQSGIYNENYGCNEVVLNKIDILSSFDVEYFNYMQGCCYYNGKIFSLEGFDYNSSSKPVLRIIDLNKNVVIKSINLFEYNLKKEPEIITVDLHEGKIYFASSDGILRELILNYDE